MPSGGNWFIFSFRLFFVAYFLFPPSPRPNVVRLVEQADYVSPTGETADVFTSVYIVGSSLATYFTAPSATQSVMFAPDERYMRYLK